MRLYVDVLEESFDLIAPRGDELMDVFYEKVFTAAPGARPMFAIDMTEQKRMLLSMLVLLRKSLRRLETIIPTLEELGARHAARGVEEEHYPVVGNALLEAMAQVGGDQWRQDYTDAWADAYTVVQETMLAGAAAAATPVGAEAATTTA